MERLAWIFGSSRSGSTWLLRMLSGLRGVVPIDDPHLGHHLGVWRPIPLAWAACEEPPPLSTLLDVKATEPGYFFAERHRDCWEQPLRSLIEARFEAEAAEIGEDAAGSAYVVKEPGSHVAPLLTELFPGSKVVFLLRDGRDVVDSWLDAYSEGSWATPGGAFPVSPEGRIALIRWLSAVWSFRSRAVREAYESCASGDRVLVRYEELLEHTTPCLRRICETIEVDAAGLARVVECNRFEQVEARGAKQEIRSACPGSWQENLTPEERAAMQEALGPALEEFGYAISASAAA
jgi:hypothetical protein